MVQRLRTPEHDALRLICIAVRNAAGLSQDDLAKRLKRSRNYVSRVETGEQHLDFLGFKHWMAACDQNDIVWYARWTRWHEPALTAKELAELGWIPDERKGKPRVQRKKSTVDAASS